MRHTIKFLAVLPLAFGLLTGCNASPLATLTTMAELNQPQDYSLMAVGTTKHDAKLDKRQEAVKDVRQDMKADEKKLDKRQEAVKDIRQDIKADGGKATKVDEARLDKRQEAVKDIRHDLKVDERHLDKRQEAVKDARQAR